MQASDSSSVGYRLGQARKVSLTELEQLLPVDAYTLPEHLANPPKPAAAAAAALQPPQQAAAAGGGGGLWQQARQGWLESRPAAGDDSPGR